MKIALVHMRHANSGGTELFLNQLSRYLAEKGEDVTIICRSHVEPSHPSIKFVQLRPFGLGKAHRMWRFAQAVEKHVKEASYDFVYGLGKTWTHDMLRIGGGTHLHFLQSSGRKKLRFKDKVSLEIERRAMAPGACRHIVANSHKSANEISEAYQVLRENISVIHNFVDTTHFDRARVKEQADQLVKQLEVDTTKPVFLFLGTGYERKGLKSALEALSELNFESTLMIVGRESNQDEYKAYAKQLGVETQCKFLGARLNPELFFSIADCYVLPAHYEPFGFTVIEALSCGIPVITTEQCGAKEVLIPEVSTVISDAKNIVALSEAMEYWGKEKVSADLSNSCRKLAQTLDIKNVLEENYQKILAVYVAKKQA